MVKKETEKIGSCLKNLLVNKKIQVNKIIIFGSVIRDDEGRDSDIDIIVVSKDFRDKDIFEKVELVNGIHRELVKKIDRPVDIMYYSDIEWEKGYSLIINTAKCEGEVIYSD